MGDTEINVYLTCYVLYDGRIRYRRMMHSFENPSIVYEKGSAPSSGYTLGEEAFQDKADAIAAAEKMRDERAQEYEAAVAHLRNMSFVVDTD